MIPVTKPYLPSRKSLDKYIDGIYERRWLTNNGLLVQELTKRLECYLGVENLLLVSNGTLALQIAYRALGIKQPGLELSAEAITTPFSFIATSSSLKWEGVEPIFTDIDPKTWCLDPANIEAAITPNTRALVPVHVFGNCCDVNAIDCIAKKHNLKVIYDASHAFAVKYEGESILRYGDAATLSFHATKLFHTGEGGAIIFKRKEHLEVAKKMINFGITGPDTIEELGINAKMNELQAAMGLCVLDEMASNLNARSRVWDYYASELKNVVEMQKKSEKLHYNFAYFPAVFESELQAMNVVKALEINGVLARRYFYPSLESLTLFSAQNKQPISSNIASRIICLPIFNDLNEVDQLNIIKLIKSTI